MATVTLTKGAPIRIKGVEITLVEEKEKAVEKAARLRASDAKARADAAFVKAEDLLRTIQLCVGCRAKIPVGSFRKCSTCCGAEDEAEKASIAKEAEDFLRDLPGGALLDEGFDSDFDSEDDSEEKEVKAEDDALERAIAASLEEKKAEDDALKRAMTASLESKRIEDQVRADEVLAEDLAIAEKKREEQVLADAAMARELADAEKEREDQFWKDAEFARRLAGQP